FAPGEISRMAWTTATRYFTELPRRLDSSRRVAVAWRSMVRVWTRAVFCIEEIRHSAGRDGRILHEAGVGRPRHQRRRLRDTRVERMPVVRVASADSRHVGECFPIRRHAAKAVDRAFT